MDRSALRCALVLAAALAGCVERTTYATSDESDRVARLIDSAPPAKIEHRLNVDFDGAVELLGYDLDRPEVHPGDELTVTWHWRCLGAPGAGWRLFTHVVDGDDRSRINQDEVGPIREHFQPEHWRPGLYIRDPQRIRVPRSWKSKVVDLRVGLWRGDDRMSIESGPEDGADRARGPVVRVVGARSDVQPIARAAAAPEIDGAFAGEEAWAGASRLDPFCHTISGEPARRHTDVRAMWDDDHLYLAMRARDDLLKTRYTEHDDELWHDDVFEVFLDPGGDKKHYYEIQVSPAGVVFDSHLPAYRKNRNAWSSGARAAVRADGTLNDDAADRGWTAELAIPFAALDRGGHVPPAPGDEWTANFFRVDLTATKPQYTAWSPPLRGDFHALDRFGRIRFAATGNGAAGAAAEVRKKDATEAPGKDAGERRDAAAAGR